MQQPEPYSGHTREQLLSIYNVLWTAYGPQHWWPADEPFEVAVGAILTQSTAWTNVERAIANLKRAAALSPSGLLHLDPSELAALIRPSGYFNQKAKKLRAFVQHLAQRHGGSLERLLALDIAELRIELLGVHGIGPETADSIILYAAGKPIFVVDAYTARLFGRIGFAEAERSYDELQRLFMDHLPRDARLFNEYHALIVRHGKHVCQKSPQCGSCLFAERCPACTL